MSPAALLADKLLCKLGDLFGVLSGDNLLGVLDPISFIERPCDLLAILRKPTRFAEVIIFFILAFLPNSTPAFWITVPITFAASMQVLTFRTVGPHPYISTSTTGNLSTLSTGLFDWLFTTDRETARSKSCIFAIICGRFLVGATTGSLAVARWGNCALMLEVILLLLIAIRVKDV